MAKIKQIYYSDWGDELASGHENYWSKVSAIAKVLAAQLEFSVHGYSEQPCFYSSIAVRDFKEKFGEIRIYCSFADPYLVKQKYEDYINVLNRSNLAYKAFQNGEEVPDWKRRMYEKLPQEYPKKAVSLEEFSEQKYFEDACWYRQVYLDTIELFPEYEDVICGVADWNEFLYRDPDKLDKDFQKRLDYYKDNKVDEEAYFINQINKQWDLAKRVCFPKGGQ